MLLLLATAVCVQQLKLFVAVFEERRGKINAVIIMIIMATPVCEPKASVVFSHTKIVIYYYIRDGLLCIRYIIKCGAMDLLPFFSLLIMLSSFSPPKICILFDS